MFELIFNLFNGDLMKKENNNSDNFLDEQVKASLFKATSDMFPDEVMKRIHLKIEFAREDRKFSRFAKSLIIGFSSSIFLFIALLGVYIFEKPDENSVILSSVISSAYDFLNRISSQILSTVGFSGTGDNLLYLAVISLIILLLFLTEKLLIHKKINN
jgi:hypothetical protein